MTLSTGELEYLRSKVGSKTPPTDADLQEKYDRLGTLDAVARVVLETRLADFQADPASYTISGEYSQDVGKNIETIMKTLASLGGTSPLDPETTGGGGTVRVLSPEPADSR